MCSILISRSIQVRFYQGLQQPNEPYVQEDHDPATRFGTRISDGIGLSLGALIMAGIVYFFYWLFT